MLSAKRKSNPWQRDLCSKLSFVLGFSFVFCPTTAKAARLTTGSFNAGSILFLNDDSPEATAGFLLNEDIFFSFTFDDTIPDDRPGSERAEYRDVNGTVTLVGGTSKASITYQGGVNLEFDSNREFEIDNVDSFQDDATPGNPILENDIDYRVRNTPIFTNINNLALTLSELNNFTLIPNQQKSSTATTEFFDLKAGEPRIGMEFGPAPTTSVAVPEPLTILGTGLAFAFGAVFKTKKNHS